MARPRLSRDRGRLTDHPARSGGRLLAGTSGFAYRDWSPRFYPPDVRGEGLLRHYAARFPAVELNNTFYRRPTAEAAARWLESTPPAFRFAMKVQRSAASGLATGREIDLAWLTDPYRALGERLGMLLLVVPKPIRRADDRLAAILAGWPTDLPLAVEFGDPSWQVDEVYALLAGADAALCITERPEDQEPPIVRWTGGGLYLRLRRHEYTDDELAAWADRIVPFIDDGRDVYAFFRHDETGRATELAAGLAGAVSRRLR